MVSFGYKDFKKDVINHKNPICPNCKQNLRPHIMFFDEFYQ